MSRTPENEAIAISNNAILDLKPGDQVQDEEGEYSTFVSYGPREPIYVNLSYPNIRDIQRLPNSNLRRVYEVEASGRRWRGLWARFVIVNNTAKGEIFRPNSPIIGDRPNPFRPRPIKDGKFVVNGGSGTKMIFHVPK